MDKARAYQHRGIYRGAKMSESKNAFEELYDCLKRKGYFEADEQERGKIWKDIAREWNEKAKNA